MTDMTVLRSAAATARMSAASASGAEPMTMPRGRPERQPVRMRSELRASKVMRDDMQWYQVEGYASTVETPYEMYDMFGPYTEIVAAGAFGETLAAAPQVVYRFNHGGMPMASTQNGRLELWSDETGLGDRAWLNPKRGDVQDLIHAMDDQDVTEQSFMFTITNGQWSPDYTEYRINQVDLDRGDVGPVTYGANPYTSVAARSGEFLADIPHMPALLAREAYTLLSQRTDLTSPPAPAPAPAPAPPEPVAAPTDPAGPQKQGRSIAMIRTRLLVEQDEE
jgi:HK97 family phage prohead protease